MLRVKGYNLTDRQYRALLHLYTGFPIGTEVSEDNLKWVEENF